MAFPAPGRFVILAAGPGQARRRRASDQMARGWTGGAAAGRTPRRDGGRRRRGTMASTGDEPAPPVPGPFPTPEVPVEPIPSPMRPSTPDEPGHPGLIPRPGTPAGPQPEAPPPSQPRHEAGASPEALRELGTAVIPTPRSRLHCLTIIGQIEGHLVLPSQNKTTKYEHIIPQLVAIEQNPDIDGLLVVLNTVGGDVEAGLAIAEMVASLSKPTVSLVLGGGHSIGVPVAVSCDHSFITNTATMTIHPIRLTGLVIGVPQTYEYLDKMQDRVVKFVVANSRITERRYRELMFRTGELARDIGTVLVGRDAVTERLMDDVGGLSEAVAKLSEMVAQREAGYRRATERREEPREEPRHGRPREAGPRRTGPREAGPREAGPRRTAPREAGPRRRDGGGRAGTAGAGGGKAGGGRAGGAGAAGGRGSAGTAGAAGGRRGRRGG